MSESIKKQRTKSYRGFNDLPAVREWNQAEKARKETARLRREQERERQRAMIAITKLDDCYSIGNTETLDRGEYSADGTLLRGLLVLPKEEAAFRIWFQQQPEMNEAKARLAWKKKTQ